MNYVLFKHLHMTAAGLSILFFVIRAYWSVTESTRLRGRFVKIAPHIIDTILLVAGVILASMIGPEQPWIMAKVVALVLYIVVGTFAIKRGKTPQIRATAAVLAVAIFVYIVGVAIKHDPMSWLA